MEREVGRYKQSSYRYQAYGDSDPLLMANPLDGELGGDAKERQKGYQQFVASRIERGEEYQKHIESKTAVGEEWFLKALEEKMAIQINRRKRGRPRKEIIKK